LGRLKTLKRGEVHWAVLKPRSGSEQTGKRPAIVISNDGFNTLSTWRSVIVIPLSTSSKQAKRGPTAVFLPKGEGGLSKDSIALCHQITTLDQSKLVGLIGTLSSAALSEVEEGLKAAVDL
jgi:mRNA interferase MazF